MSHIVDIDEAKTYTFHALCLLVETRGEEEYVMRKVDRVAKAFGFENWETWYNKSLPY